MALQRATRVRESGQHGLFWNGSAPAPVAFEMREAELWSEEERLASEYAMLGFYVSGPSPCEICFAMQELKTVALAEIEGQRNGKEVAVAVLIVGVRPMRSRKERDGPSTRCKNDRRAGVAGLSGKFREAGERAKAGNAAVAQGARANRGSRDAALVAGSSAAGRYCRAQGPLEFRVRLEMGSLNESTLDQLGRIVCRLARSEPRAILSCHSPDGSVAVMQARQRVTVNPELIESVRQIAGAQSIELVM